MLQHIYTTIGPTEPQLKTTLAVKTCISIALIYFLLSMVYALTLHPLRKIPGPLFARCSDLWGRYQNMYGRKSHQIHAAHKKFGQSLSFGLSEPKQLSNRSGQVLLCALRRIHCRLRTPVLFGRSICPRYLSKRRASTWVYPPQNRPITS